MGCKDEDWDEAIHNLQGKAFERLEGYPHRLQLGNDWRSGDSIVRSFELH